MMIFEPFRAIDRLTTDLLTTGLLAGGAAPSGMPVDLYREGDHYVLNADLPGVRPDSVDVSVDGQVLTVRAERAVETSDGVQWLVKERPSVSLLRQFSVSDDVDVENITAHYENGVLSVVVPVVEQARARKIQIGGASEPQRGLDAGAAESDAQSQKVPAEVKTER